VGYKEMKKKLSDKKKLIAYILNKDPEFELSQKKIADILGVNQSTVSNAIKEMKYLVKIRKLDKELKEAKKKIAEMGILPEQEKYYIQ